MTNSYIEAQKIWDDRYGALAIGKRNWQIASAIGALVSVVFCFGLVKLSLAQKIEYVFVQVDKAGYAAQINLSEAASQNAPEKVLRNELLRLIQKLKTVSSDALIMKQNLDIAYKGYLRGTAVPYVNEYYQENDPFELAKENTISIEPISILRITERSWQIRWKEILRSRDGYKQGSTEWEAHLVTELEKPDSKDDENLKYNPTGIRVLELSWTKVI